VGREEKLSPSCEQSAMAITQHYTHIYMRNINDTIVYKTEKFN
jgi:hypothetical protein